MYTRFRIAFFTVLFPFVCFSQVTKQAEIPHEVRIPTKEISQYERDLYEKLSTAKKNGDESGVIRIENELNEFYKKNQTNNNISTNRKWKIADDVIIIGDNQLTSNEKVSTNWGDDRRITDTSDHEKAVSIACQKNGYLYAAYENASSGSIAIRRSTDGGQSWHVFSGISGFGKPNADLLWPCLTLGEGNKDKLIISCYSSNKKVLIFSWDLNNNQTDFVWLEAPEVGGSENIRPRLAVDTDNGWYIYITWVEEDSGLNGDDDLYYSRSTDYGNSFSDPMKLLAGVENNVDIGWGNDNLYIVYQADGWPGKIKLIKSNSSYGNPSEGWSDPILLSTNEDKYVYPRIAVSDYDNKACVIYTKILSSTDHDVKYYVTLNSNSWLGPYTIADRLSIETLADIYYMPHSSSGDNFHAAWYDDGSIKYSKTDNLASWQTNITLSDNSNNSEDDFVSVTASPNNEGMVAWVHKWTSTDYDVYFDSNVVPTLPDLIVQNARIEPTTVKPGESVTAYCDVKNQGNGEAGSSRIRYYLSSDQSYGSSDEELGRDGVSGLWPGVISSENESITIPSSTSAGRWYILFFADADNEVEESNENNNVVYVQITIDDDDNYEPNNTQSSAYDLSSSEDQWLSAINGKAIQKDDDWYKIFVDANYRSVQIVCSFTHSEGDIDMALIDNSEKVLVESESTSDNEEISYTVESSGYYYIKVYYRNAGNEYDLIWDDKLTSVSHSPLDNVISDYRLEQNYPNPFNPVTTISFQIPKASEVNLSIFSVEGKLLETLVNEHKDIGIYHVEWDASQYGSGVYFYRIKTTDYKDVKKCAIIK